MMLRSKIVFALTVAVALGAALYFEPWTLFTSSSIDESLPSVQKVDDHAETEPVDERPEVSGPAGAKEPEIEYPLTVARGNLISHEHETSGQVLILELEDGSRVLRLEKFSTSDGPQLEVWITDAPVIEGLDGWFVFDDGKYENLGDLKATNGNQNYSLPDSLDIDNFSSVSIWCSRFAVSFGAAELRT